MRRDRSKSQSCPSAARSRSRRRSPARARTPSPARTRPAGSPWSGAGVRRDGLARSQSAPRARRSPACAAPRRPWRPSEPHQGSGTSACSSVSPFCDTWERVARACPSAQSFQELDLKFAAKNRVWQLSPRSANHASSGEIWTVLAGKQSAQAFSILSTCGAALEVRPHAGKRRVGVGASEQQLDVAVEPLEAVLAADLRLGGSEDASQQAISVIGLVCAHVDFRASVAPRLMPWLAKLARSFLRASCRVL